MALAQRALGGLSATVLLLGIAAAALFYGNAVITPALSVLSAVEGLEIVAPQLQPYITPISIVILLGLFIAQSRGTARMGAFFGPIMVFWFATLAFFGVIHIWLNPSVLAAVNPVYGISFLAGTGLIVEHCNISGFATAGISVTTAAAAALIVHDTYITHNGAGVTLAPTAALTAGFRDVKAEGNNAAGFSIGANAGALIDQSSALLNATGINVLTSGVLFLGNTEVAGNVTGVSNAGVVNTYKTNEINGNVTNTTGNAFIPTALQ